MEKVTLVTDRDRGRSRGFGFGEMTNAAQADKAARARLVVLCRCIIGIGLIAKCLSIERGRRNGISMPRGKSTFTKRQKEHTRQQKQRDKAERRNQRKQEKAVAGGVDEIAELREHAAEQAALFNLGGDDVDTAEESTAGDQVNK